MQFIDLTIQQKAIREELDRRIAAVLNHGQYIMGPEVKELEDVLRDYVGVRHCITVSSGTDALLISLMALGIGPGDEVITTPFTFISTAEVVARLGATPVFVDVECDTGLIDAELIQQRITPRTKAIMPVSLYGQISDMDRINEIAVRHGNIPVIEDAAQSFGATYRGQRSCGVSTIGCTSFFPSKPLGCYGDGGAIFTSDDELAGIMRDIRIHGQTRRYWHERVGVGGRMDTIQCAILLAKWVRFEKELAMRRKVAANYTAALNSVANAGLRLPIVREGRQSVYAQYTVRVANRNAAEAAMEAARIPYAIHYPTPINRQPCYQKFTHDALNNATLLSRTVLSLPMGPDLAAGTITKVAKALGTISSSENATTAA